MRPGGQLAYELQDIPLFQAPFAAAGRKFKYASCAKNPWGKMPWFETPKHTEHFLLLVQENRVYGKPHKAHVDHGARLKPKPIFGAERASWDKPEKPGNESIGPARRGTYL
jgi:hypothetical protein